MQQRSDAVLEVRGLTKYFHVGGGGPFGFGGEPRMLHAVEDVSFTLRRGKILALVGESGSGKSTIARLLVRLYPATRGQALLDGKDILKVRGRTALLKYRGQVQMVFQDPFGSLNPVKTVAHHIVRPLQIHKEVDTGRGRAMNQVHELLRIVGLTPPEEMATKYPHQLSGGQRQRVSFARALAANPEVVLRRAGPLLFIYYPRPGQRPLHRRRDDGALRRTRGRDGQQRGCHGRPVASVYSAAAQCGAEPERGTGQA